MNMKRYRFRLEQVRNVRRVQEDLALAALRDADRGATAAADAEAARTERFLAESGPTPAGQSGSFVADHERLARAASAVEAAGLALSTARLAAAEQRTEWSGAARRVAALDRLDDRHRTDHGLGEQRAFEREIDDIVVARRLR